MNDEHPSSRDAARLLAALRHRRELSHRSVEEKGLSAEKAMLRAWQSQRLARTHADLLASPRYGPACRFFLEDIYAPKDFSQRNQDLIRMHEFMLRFLPAGVIHTLTDAIELNSLTEELDERLLSALVEQLGVRDNITPAQYAEAYRICDNYDDRLRQIEMIVQVGKGIDRLVRLPLVGWTLRLARGPARRGGWHQLQDFLERGFRAFKHMGGAGHFLQTIERREKQILDQIFAGAADPFRVDE
ncbi:MAG: hypothetical protein D6775_07705 [Caldilineae bacterium]|nr:MAG: hypothetical protein D6775_07705 [Caldilineae bacterium]